MRPSPGSPCYLCRSVRSKLLSLVAALVAIVVVPPPQARAQASSEAARPTAEVAAEAVDVGDSVHALPGLHRLPALVVGEPRVAVAVTTGYGATLADDGTHHRLVLIPALGWVAAPWLEIGASVDARYDVHPGNDFGLVMDPRFLGRLRQALSGNTQLGAELGLWLPGTESASSSLSAATPEASLFLSTGSAAWLVSGKLGYRLDRSRNAGRNAPRLSRGDRLALGLSEFDAVLAGLGAAYHVAGWTVFAEASAELLVGQEAPGFTASPLRLEAGARRRISRQLELEALLRGSLSQPPPVGPGQPLVPIEPQATLLVGVHYRFVDEPPPTIAPSATTRAKPKPVVEKPKVTLEVSVVDADGAPIDTATVSLRTEQGELNAALQPDGRYLLEGLMPGTARLQVEAQGYAAASQEVVLRAEPVKPRVILARVLTGQIRGLVRTFGGTGISANIQLEPGGQRVTADADGFFRLDVAPGEYEVLIEAIGFVTQRRKVSVEKDGVVIINADLVKGQRAK
jgi:hypothetical protein